MDSILRDLVDQRRFQVRTNDKLRLLAHMLERPKMISFTLYGYLRVTTVLTPTKALAYPDGVYLDYKISAVVGSEVYGDRMQPIVFRFRKNEIDGRPGGKSGLMKQVARTVAMSYLRDGGGVRGRFGSKYRLNVWINEKNRIDDLLLRLPGKTGDDLHKARAHNKSVLWGRGRELELMRVNNQLGAARAKAEEWLR
jgi:hypothetical protein